MAIQNIIMTAAGLSGAAAHRYWRIAFTTSQSPTTGALAEVQMHSVIGGADLTVSGGSATAGSVGASQVASRAIDNNTSSYWLSDGASYADCWWQYDFGATTPQAIVEVSITEGNPSYQYGPLAFALQYSDNNTSFVNFKSWTTPSWTSVTTTRVFN